MNVLHAVFIVTASCVVCWMTITAMVGTLLPVRLGFVYEAVPEVWKRALVLSPILVGANLTLMKGIALNPAWGASAVTLATIVLPGLVVLLQNGSKPSLELGLAMVAIAALCLGWLPKAIGRALAAG